MARSPNLSAEDVTVILEILDGWSGKLSWNHLIDRVERKLLFRYTRQSLYGHERIAKSFQLTKRRIQGQAGRPPVENPVLQKALEKCARLEAEVARLSSENERLISKFIRWAYNAHLRGMTEAQLEQPLPPMGGRRGAHARRQISGK